MTLILEKIGKQGRKSVQFLSWMVGFYVVSAFILLLFWEYSFFSLCNFPRSIPQSFLFLLDLLGWRWIKYFLDLLCFYVYMLPQLSLPLHPHPNTLNFSSHFKFSWKRCLSEEFNMLEDSNLYFFTEEPLESLIWKWGTVLLSLFSPAWLGPSLLLSEVLTQNSLK